MDSNSAKSWKVKMDSFHQIKVYQDLKMPNVE